MLCQLTTKAEQLMAEYNRRLKAKGFEVVDDCVLIYSGEAADQALGHIQ